MQNVIDRNNKPQTRQISDKKTNKPRRPQDETVTDKFKVNDFEADILEILNSLGPKKPAKYFINDLLEIGKNLDNNCEQLQYLQGISNESLNNLNEYGRCSNYPNKLTIISKDPKLPNNTTFGSIIEAKGGEFEGSKFNNDCICLYVVTAEDGTAQGKFFYFLAAERKLIPLLPRRIASKDGAQQLLLDPQYIECNLNKLGINGLFYGFNTYAIDAVAPGQVGITPQDLAQAHYNRELINALKTAIYNNLALVEKLKALDLSPDKLNVYYESLANHYCDLVKALIKRVQFNFSENPSAEPDYPLPYYQDIKITCKEILRVMESEPKIKELMQRKNIDKKLIDGFLLLTGQRCLSSIPLLYSFNNNADKLQEYKEIMIS